MGEEGAARPCEGSEVSLSSEDAYEVDYVGDLKDAAHCASGLRRVGVPLADGGGDVGRLMVTMEVVRRVDNAGKDPNDHASRSPDEIRLRQLATTRLD